MDTTALLIPIFLLIVCIEWLLSIRSNSQRYTFGNVVMNMTIGAIDQLGSILYFSLLYMVLDYVFIHYRLLALDPTWYMWVWAYIAVDFLSYWYHRCSHRINILWAGHVTHHSSELFNFSNGFRTSLFQGINRIAFWSVLPVFGFTPAVLVITLKISGLYDFLLHTEHVRKLGFLEKILITPSHHRVHHGQNDIFIDKNYGSTFVIWDKLFGTFQEETENVRYGIRGHYQDTNPLTAIGHHYLYLWKIIRSLPMWHDKVKLLFMPPEWNPLKMEQASNSILQSPTPVSSLYYCYTILQIAGCVTGIILLLVYRSYMVTWEFILYAFVGVYTLVNHARLLNGATYKDFIQHELPVLLAEILLVTITLYLYPRYYGVAVLMILLVSLVLLGMKSRARHQL
jgi:alkylglycerol monooxygenase